MKIYLSLFSVMTWILHVGRRDRERKKKERTKTKSSNFIL